MCGGFNEICSALVTHTLYYIDLGGKTLTGAIGTVFTHTQICGHTTQVVLTYSICLIPQDETICNTRYLRNVNMIISFKLQAYESANI